MVFKKPWISRKTKEIYKLDCSKNLFTTFHSLSELALYNKNIPAKATTAMPIVADKFGISPKTTVPKINANKIALYLKGDMKDISPERITKTAV